MDFKLLVKGVNEGNKQEKFEKAVAELSKAMDLPITIRHREKEGESFIYQAQEDLVEKWIQYVGKILDAVYLGLCKYFDLPKITTFRKAVNDNIDDLEPLMFKGKILFNPETGKPITRKQWKEVIAQIERFLNRHLKDVEKKIILESEVLGRILNRMLKYNTREAIQALKLEELKYKNRKFETISDSIKKLRETFNLSDFDTQRLILAEDVLGEHITALTNNLKSGIKKVFTQGIRERKSKGKLVQDLFDGFGDINRDWRRIVEYEVNDNINNAFLSEEKANSTPDEKIYLQRLEIIDQGTCKHCEKINGKIVLLVDEPLPDEKIKDKYAEIAIWPGKSNIGRSSREWWIAAGSQHPYCYSSDTEVLTNRGWKIFSDLLDDDLIMAINPKTKEIDFVPYVRKITYLYKGEMIHFCGRNYDLLVTPDHRMLYCSRKSNKLLEARAEDLFSKSEISFPRAIGLWKNFKDISALSIKGKTITVNTIVRLWAWFLSDGSARKRKKKRIEVKISQKDPTILLSDLKEIQEYIHIYEGAVYIYEPTLTELFREFIGVHADTKYIPDYIKYMSPNLLRDFIDSYSKADGHNRKGKKASDNSYTTIRGEEIVFYTSSNKLASDLGEIIIKAGYIPSYSIVFQKGKYWNFPNGRYKSNFDIHVIRICRSKYRRFSRSMSVGKIERVSYDDYVYDVELEKWHFLCVRRNGKVAWSGNCRGSWERVYPDLAEELGVDVGKMMGEVDNKIEKLKREKKEE